MLTKCSNPPCSASFQSLEDGKLFRLEPDGVLRTGEPKRIEYYWLCERCASTMTLRLGDHDKVIAVALPAPLQGVPDNVPGALVDRRGGLLLQGVASLLPKPNGKPIRTYRSNRRNVA